MKGCKKMLHANSKHKIARVTMLISDKNDTKLKKIARDNITNKNFNETRQVKSQTGT